MPAREGGITQKATAQVRRLAANRRLRLTVIWVVGIVAFIAIAGFLVAPPIVRYQLEKQLTQKLHRTVTVERVRINPFTLSASIERFQVNERQGTHVALSFDTLYVDVAYQSLVRLAPVVESLRLHGPYVHLVRNEDRSYNFQDLIDEFTASKPQPTEPAAPPQFAIFNIELAGGKIDFDDRPEKTAHEVSELGIGVPFISSIPRQVDIRVRPRLSAKVNGAPFELGGETKPFKDTHETKLNFSLEGLQIAKYLEYSPVPLQVRVPSGQLDAKVVIALATTNDSLQTLTVAGTAALRDLVIQTANGAPLLAFEALQVELDALDLVARKADVKAVTLQRPAVNLLRSRDGKLNWFGLVGSEQTASADAKDNRGEAKSSDDTQFAFTLRAASIAGGKVELVDESTPSPLKLGVDALALDVHDVSRSSERGAPVRWSGVKLGFNTDNQGKVAFDGALQLTPLKLDGALSVDGFQVPALGTYFDQWLNVVVSGGAAATKGTLAIEQMPGQPLRGAYRGEASVSGFASRDKVGGQDLLRWKTLSAEGIELQFEPFGARVNQLTLADFYSRLIVNSNGTLNLQNVLKRPEAPAGNAPPEQPPQPRSAQSSGTALPVAIARIVFKDGRINFSDFFVKPNYSADLLNVRGSVSEMAPDKAGNVTVHASVGKSAPVEILGKINPFAKDLYLDINASARDIDMPSLSPYAVKYAGYGIEKGTLAFKAKYHLERRQLQAENNIYLDQLAFGQHVASPTATKLPVTLAVALLKDRNGVIDINLPISGSLDDPQFSLGGVLVRVFVNLLTKVVTSPFALLGNLVGHGGPELGYVEFAPGRGTLTGADQGKLGALAKALDQRPALKLEVTGRVDPAADREGIKRVALERQIKAQKLKQSSSKTAQPVEDDAPLDDLKLDPKEYAKLLTAVYRDAKFNRPRNALGFLKDIPVPEMEQLLLANTPASDDDLRGLADARARVVKDWLTESGKVPAERIFLLAPRLDAQDIKDKGKPTRADFSFR